MNNMETKVPLQEENVKKPSFLGMVTSPSQQFERMKENTALAMPLVFMLLFMAVTGSLASYLSLRNPVLKDAVEVTGFKIPTSVTVGMGAVGSVIGGVIVFLIAAGFYKLIMVILGNDISYKKILLIIIFASFISSLGLLVNALIALVAGGYGANYTSLAPIMGDHKLLGAIGGNFDVFSIWYYILLAIGFQIVAGLSRNKAITIVVIVFLLGIGFSSLSGLVPVPGM